MLCQVHNHRNIWPTATSYRISWAVKYCQELGVCPREIPWGSKPGGEKNVRRRHARARFWLECDGQSHGWNPRRPAECAWWYPAERIGTDLPNAALPVSGSPTFRTSYLPAAQASSKRPASLPCEGSRKS